MRSVIGWLGFYRQNSRVSECFLLWNLKIMLLKVCNEYFIVSVGCHLLRFFFSFYRTNVLYSGITQKSFDTLENEWGIVVRHSQYVNVFLWNQKTDDYVKNIYIILTQTLTWISKHSRNIWRNQSSLMQMNGEIRLNSFCVFHALYKNRLTYELHFQ